MAQQQPVQHPLALPKTLSPDALDTIPELASILARLRPPQSTTALSGMPADTAAATGATPLPTATPSLGGSGAAAGTSVGGGATLSLKDVPTATDNLKHKLQRARVQIRTLPDMSRTIAEQEEEIQELEAKMRLQREVLDRLREIGNSFVTEESSRGDRMEA